jgi:hypothetical protein
MNFRLGWHRQIFDSRNREVTCSFDRIACLAMERRNGIVSNYSVSASLALAAHLAMYVDVHKMEWHNPGILRPGTLSGGAP